MTWRNHLAAVTMEMQCTALEQNGYLQSVSPAVVKVAMFHVLENAKANPIHDVFPSVAPCIAGNSSIITISSHASNLYYVRSLGIILSLNLVGH